MLPPPLLPPSAPPPPAPPPSVVVRVHWPLYTVYPASVLFFWFLYLAVIPWLSNRYCFDYRGWMVHQQMAWGQNVNYLVHSVVVIIPLVVVMNTHGSELYAAGLLPYYNELAYIDICLSLGYMSFTLPWSLHVWFRMKRRDMGTNKGLIVHHVAVVVAEVVYLLTQVAPWYGALSLILFELSNLNAAPHLLMTQLRYSGPLHFINGVCFLITYTGSRIIACTILGVLYVIDYARLDSDEWAAWLALGVCIAVYWVLMVLSYFWYQRDVMKVTHQELKRYLGADYLRRCCPCAASAPRSLLRTPGSKASQTPRQCQAQAQALESQTSSTPKPGSV